MWILNLTLISIAILLLPLCEVAENPKFEALNSKQYAKGVRWGVSKLEFSNVLKGRLGDFCFLSFESFGDAQDRFVSDFDIWFSCFTTLSSIHFPSNLESQISTFEARFFLNRASIIGTNLRKWSKKVWFTKCLKSISAGLKTTKKNFIFLGFWPKALAHLVET